MDSLNPLPSMKFCSINHADREDPVGTRYSEWRCVDTNRFIGDVPGLSKPAKLILHSGKTPLKGRIMAVENATAMLPIGPLPLPDTISILAKDCRHALIQIPIHGNSIGLEAEELISQITLLQNGKKARLQEALAVVGRHFHIVLFDFGRDDRRRPGKLHPPPDDGGEPVNWRKILETA